MEADGSSLLTLQSSISCAYGIFTHIQPHGPVHHALHARCGPTCRLLALMAFASCYWLLSAVSPLKVSIYHDENRQAATRSAHMTEADKRTCAMV